MKKYKILIIIITVLFLTILTAGCSTVNSFLNSAINKSNDDWVEKIGYENFIPQGQGLALVRVADDYGNYVYFGIQGGAGSVFHEIYAVLIYMPNNEIAKEMFDAFEEGLNELRLQCNSNSLTVEEAIKIWADGVECPIRMGFEHGNESYFYNMARDKFETVTEDGESEDFKPLPRKEANAIPNSVKEYAKKYSLYNWIEGITPYKTWFDWIISIGIVVLIFFVISAIFLICGVIIHSISSAISPMLNFFAGIGIGVALCIYAVLSEFNLYSIISAAIYILCLFVFYNTIRKIEPRYKNMSSVKELLNVSWWFMLSYIIPATLLTFPFLLGIVEKLPFSVSNIEIHFYVYMGLCVFLGIVLAVGSDSKAKEFYEFIKNFEKLTVENIKEFSAKSYQSEDSSEEKARKDKEAEQLVSDFVSAGILEKREVNGETIYRIKSSHSFSLSEDNNKSKTKPKDDDYIANLKQIQSEIKDQKMLLKIDEIEKMYYSIFDFLQKNPSETNISKTKQFLDFYFPATIKLFESYHELSENNIDNFEKLAVIGKIHSAIDDIISVFKNHYNSLYENKILDIETDIEALKTIMQKDGLLNIMDFKDIK